MNKEIYMSVNNLGKVEGPFPTKAKFIEGQPVWHACDRYHEDKPAAVYSTRWYVYYQGDKVSDSSAEEILREAVEEYLLDEISDCEKEMFLIQDRQRAIAEMLKKVRNPGEQPHEP